MGLEHGHLQDHTGTRTICSAPWEPVATRRGFTGLLDAVLAGLQNPAGCSVAATRVWAYTAAVNRCSNPPDRARRSVGRSLGQ